MSGAARRALPPSVKRLEPAMTVLVEAAQREVPWIDVG
jgi:hypothetical protein